MFAATLLTADREECSADTVCKDHETRRRERRQERKRQEDVRQTVTLIACVCVCVSYIKSQSCNMNQLTGCCVSWELEWSLILTTSREIITRER